MRRIKLPVKGTIEQTAKEAIKGLKQKHVPMSDAESDALMLQRHPEMRNSMTTEQLGEAMTATVRAMDADQKAIFRARLNRSLGLVKTSGGKPS